MKHVFYFFDIFFILYTLIGVTNPRKLLNFQLEGRELTKKKREKALTGETLEPNEVITEKSFEAYCFCLFLLYIWLFAGLISFQWPLFEAYLIYTLFISANIFSAVKKLFKKPKPFLSVLTWVNSVIALSFSVFILINAYQLHINIWKLYFK